MRPVLLLTPIVVFALGVYADAGFLRSIIQNPVPLSSSQISIEMTSEDVLIDCGGSDIRASWQYFRF